MSHMVVERVWCCVCDGSGKVSKWLVFKGPCRVCEGTGQRRIILDSRFPDDIKQTLRNDAMFSANTRAALGGSSFGNSLANVVFGDGFWR